MQPQLTHCNDERTALIKAAPFTVPFVALDNQFGIGHVGIAAGTANPSAVSFSLEA
jgi:hypothetical protein